MLLNATRAMFNVKTESSAAGGHSNAVMRNSNGIKNRLRLFEIYFPPWTNKSLHLTHLHHAILVTDPRRCSSTFCTLSENTGIHRRSPSHTVRCPRSVQFHSDRCSSRFMDTIHTADRIDCEKERDDCFVGYVWKTMASDGTSGTSISFAFDRLLNMRVY